MSASRIQYRKLRAPQKHQAVLIEPPLSESNQLLHDNHSLIANSNHLHIFGRPLIELRADARDKLVADALKFTKSYADANFADHANLIFLSGHQPKLFHPGVWFKNVLLGQLAKKHSATAINLIIDNDLCGEPIVHVPQGSIQNPIVSAVPYDDRKVNLPFEESTISDEALFSSFGQRASNVLLEELQNNIGEFWNLVLQANSSNPGFKFAQARHLLEIEHGIKNLELPLSSVCISREFLRFFCHLIRDAGRLQQTYNTLLAEYRQVHKLRSSSHPVPDLELCGDSIEVPFWIWTEQEPSRRRLFCRTIDKHTELRDETGIIYGTIDLASNKDDAITQLEGIAQSGIKIRPRALTTTMYCRLVLSDLFVHGIGGGKYDQLTDAIAAEFFQFPLPKIQLATATIKLFEQRLSNPVGDLKEIAEDLRSFEFSPDKFARKVIKLGHPQAAALEKLVEEKLKHVQQQVTPKDRPRWHEALQDIHLQLQSLLENEHFALKTTQQVAQQRVHAFELLDSREFSFLFFNRKTLLDLLVTATKTS